MTTSPSGPLGPGAEFGPYSILRQVGRGAFGVVYEARRNPLKKRMALKILHEHVLSSPDAATRFQREIMAAAQVEHPHVIQVFDGGVRDERGFLAMEFLDGETLGERLKRDKVLRSDEIVDVLLPIASALDAVHNAGVVHRDIKPGNIFLARHVSGIAYPKLVDFGIAKLVSDELDLTQTHSWLGTPFYMSPEQVRQSKSVDARSDQWSLGVVLYEALTGEKPYRAEVLLDLLEAITSRSPTPPSEVRDTVPKGLDAVIARMMERDPTRRFPSMRAAGAALWPFASPRVRHAWARYYDREGDAAAQLDDVLEASASGLYSNAASQQSTTVHRGVDRDAQTVDGKTTVSAPKAVAHTPEGGPAQHEVHPTWRHMAMGAVLGVAGLFGAQQLMAPREAPAARDDVPYVSAAPDAAPLTAPPPPPDVAARAPVVVDASPPAVVDASAPLTVDAAVVARVVDASTPAVHAATQGGASSAPAPVRGAPYCDDDPTYREACAALQTGNRAAAVAAFAAVRSPRALVAVAHLYRQMGRLADAEEKVAQAMRDGGDAWMASHTGFTNGLLSDVQARLGSVEITCANGEAAIGAGAAARRITLPHGEPVRTATGHVQVVITNNGIAFQQYVDVRAGQTARVTACGSGS